MWQHRWIEGHHADWKKPDTERQIIKRFCLYVESKIVKFIEAESRTVVAKCSGGWAGVGWDGDVGERGWSFSYVRWMSFKI